MSGTKPEVWVVVSSNDGAPSEDSAEPRGPLVWETYTEKATRAEATRRAADLEKRHGACRIARLQFSDEITDVPF